MEHGCGELEVLMFGSRISAIHVLVELDFDILHECRD